LKNRYSVIAFAIIQLGLWGCGVGVSTIGREVIATDDFLLGQPGYIHRFNSSATSIDKTVLHQKWGPPDRSITISDSCVRDEYDHGMIWSGVLLFLGVPLPLVVPTGRSQTHFYLHNQEVVAVVQSHSSPLHAFGYFWGDHESGFVSGLVSLTPSDTLKYNITPCVVPPKERRPTIGRS